MQNIGQHRRKSRQFWHHALDPFGDKLHRGVVGHPRTQAQNLAQHIARRGIRRGLFVELTFNGDGVECRQIEFGIERSQREPLQRFFQQARFANPRFAADFDDVTNATQRRRSQRGDRVQFGLATDQ